MLLRYDDNDCFLLTGYNPPTKNTINGTPTFMNLLFFVVMMFLRLIKPETQQQQF